MKKKVGRSPRLYSIFLLVAFLPCGCKNDPTWIERSLVSEFVNPINQPVIKLELLQTQAASSEYSLQINPWCGIFMFSLVDGVRDTTKRLFLGNIESMNGMLIVSKNTGKLMRHSSSAQEKDTLLLWDFDLEKHPIVDYYSTRGDSAYCVLESVLISNSDSIYKFNTVGIVRTGEDVFTLYLSKNNGIVGMSTGQFRGADFFVNNWVGILPDSASLLLGPRSEDFCSKLKMK